MEASNTSFLESLQTRLLQLYEPTTEFREATVHKTTREIFLLLQDFYPGDYDMATMAEWLRQWGFTYTEITPFRFEWLLKKKMD